MLKKKTLNLLSILVPLNERHLQSKDFFVLCEETLICILIQIMTDGKKRKIKVKHQKKKSFKSLIGLANV